MNKCHCIVSSKLEVLPELVKGMTTLDVQSGSDSDCTGCRTKADDLDCRGIEAGKGHGKYRFLGGFRWLMPANFH